MANGQRRKVNVLEVKCLRSLIGVSRMDRVKNEEVSKRAGIEMELESRADQRVLRWCGTCHMASFVTSHSSATTAAIISQALLPESTSSPRPSSSWSLMQYFVPLLPSLMHSCKLSPYCQGVLILSSWLGASYVSVLQRACTWEYKRANSSQIEQYHFCSCTDNSSSSPVFTSPPPAALVLASLRRSCCSSVPGAAL